LPDPAARIRLHDLIHEETESVVAAISATAFPTSLSAELGVEVNERLDKYEAICGTLVAMGAAGVFHGSAQQSNNWIKCVERIANAPQNESGNMSLLFLRRYPALLVQYACGLAATAGKKYETLNALFTGATAPDKGGSRKLLAVSLHAKCIETDQMEGKLISGKERRHTPVSDHLFERLREPFREFIPDDQVFEQIFDEFEYLLSLVYADLTRLDFTGNVGSWVPLGRFASRGKDMEQDLIEQGNNWGPLKAGMFGGSLDRLLVAIKSLNSFVSKVRF
jgi:hypothetical protein